MIYLVDLKLITVKIIDNAKDFHWNFCHEFFCHDPPRILAGSIRDGFSGWKSSK